MIVVKLYGGLGNQMFQHAAGTVLAEKLGTKLYHDLSWFELVKTRPDATQRTYELNQFGIAPRRLSFLVKRRAARLPVYSQSGLGYDPGFTKINTPVILEGHWQSYRYFKSCPGLIKRLFTFPTPENKILSKQITSKPSISLHVRRGDYASNEKVNAIHGLLPKQYYETSVAMLTRNLDSPHLFLFSDDIDWVKKSFQFKQPVTFIESQRDIDDMQLMSLCQCNIIANSSFSWWAAWLNANPGKRVIAPKKWSVDPSYKYPDLIPRDWLTL